MSRRVSRKRKWPPSVYRCVKVLPSVNALIANEHRRASDQLFDLMLALPAKRAVEGVSVVEIAGFGHHRSVFRISQRGSRCRRFPDIQAPRPAIVSTIINVN